LKQGFIPGIQKIRISSALLHNLSTRPWPRLTIEERAEVKKVAHLLLVKLKSLPALNRRQRIQSGVQIKWAIGETLESYEGFTPKNFLG
jgi:hypothetical protein